MALISYKGHCGEFCDGIAAILIVFGLENLELLIRERAAFDYTQPNTANPATKVRIGGGRLHSWFAWWLSLF